MNLRNAKCPLKNRLEIRGNTGRQAEKTGKNGHWRQIPEGSGNKRKNRPNLWFGTKRPRVRAATSTRGSFVNQGFHGFLFPCIFIQLRCCNGTGCHMPVDKCKMRVPKGRCRVLPEIAEKYHTRKDMRGRNLVWILYFLHDHSPR